MPDSAPLIPSRRRFITAIGAIGVVGLAVAGGCAVPTIVERAEPLAPLRDAAQRDALELAAADSSHGEYADALRRLADIRRVHADRLGALVDGARTDEPTSTGPGPAPTCPPIDEVRARLRDDAATAAEAAGLTDGPEAELAGAVSAACTAAAAVMLS